MLEQKRFKINVSNDSLKERGNVFVNDLAFSFN